LLKMSVEEAGFAVLEEAVDKTELLQSCIRKNPDVVILDLDLPLNESVRLVEDLLDIDPTVSIIAMSDLVEGFSERVLAAGARAFLQKPFSMYDLIDLIRKVAPDKSLRNASQV
ncbi:MAG: response regulator, partial [Candidatus Hodarchaeota archaeon]